MSSGIDKSRLSNDVGRAPSTAKQDEPAIELFNYFLTEILSLPSLSEIDRAELAEDMENIMTGYSMYLQNTNIPVNHKLYLNDTTKVPTSFLKYTTLKEYLGKAILLMSKTFPDNEFLKDEEAVGDISGKKFEKACKRNQQQKDDSFGHESKIGLYRVARHGSRGGFAPHWTSLVNVEEICTNMLRQTKRGDTINKLTDKRLAVNTTQHCVGRGGETGLMDVKKFQYNQSLDVFDPQWIERKTLEAYSCPVVPNKNGWASDWYHSFGCFAACGNGLYRHKDDKSTKLFPHLAKMAGSGVSRWITEAIRKNLHDDVPAEEKKSISAVSIRIGSVTTMGAGGVSFFSSHARSGHALPTNQGKYYDKDDIHSSLTAAMCLAGWRDYSAQVSLPNLRCLGQPDAIINRVVEQLVPNSFDEFKEEGRLRPVLLAAVASLMMYDREVVAVIGPNNAPSLALREAFQKTRTVDSRAPPSSTASGPNPIDTLKYWGECIRKNFVESNPDFQPLTNNSASLQVVSAINQIASSYNNLQQENVEQRLEIRRLTTIAEGEREDRNKLYHQNKVLMKNQDMMMKQMQKLLEWHRVPQTPTSSSASTPASKRHRTKSPGNVSEQVPMPTLPPFQPATTEVTAALAANFNDVDTGDTHGGTNIEDIIISAHPFRGGAVSFASVVRPGRFNDNAKFKHCADLIDAVITDEQKAALLNELATNIDVQDRANDIAKACMKQLNVWDFKKKAKRGYTGVGARVQKVKAWNPDLDVSKLAPDPSEASLSQAAKGLKEAASKPGQQTLSFLCILC